MTDITMKQLLDAGVHFGHLTRFREPKMKDYIFGVRNKTNIINLGKTLPLLKKSIQAISKVAHHNGKILFVGTKQAAKDIVKEQAERCDMPYVVSRWLGGMLTNFKTIKQSIRRLDDLTKKLEDGTLDSLTKKEGLTIKREQAKLSDSLGGIKDMNGLPDLIFLIDSGYEKIAVKEANCLGIPVVGIVDTNSDPDGIDYIVPGNDDSLSSIKLYAELVADTIIKASASKNKQDSEKYKEEFIEVEDNKNGAAAV